MMKRALGYGILASLFFAFTFIFNRSMNLSGGYWMWGACLRYMIMLPLLGVILWRRPGNKLGGIIEMIKKQPVPWILWSTVGFGLFYLPLSLGSVFGESWLVAASWQMTIVCGILLTPLFGKKIPVKNLLMALVILTGIFILQIPHISAQDIRGNCLALVPILFAAFCYPLGNRKIMQYCPESIDTMQRVFGMTLCSMPFWALTAVFAYLNAGLPGRGQLLQCTAVAVFSGIIATNLFFHATDLVKNNPGQLALIEATQSGEVIFTLIGGILVLGDAVPSMWQMLGLFLIIIGMVLNSLMTENS